MRNVCLHFYDGCLTVASPDKLCPKTSVSGSFGNLTFMTKQVSQLCFAPVALLGLSSVTCAF